MKITKRILAVLALLLSLVMVLSSCGFLDSIFGNGPVEHACETVCTTCGKCLDTSCTEGPCANKCQGHTPAAHVCDSKCNDCGKCTDEACNESTCATKCQGHNQGGNTETNSDLVVGTAYKFGMAQGNKGGTVYYLSGGTASIYYLATNSDVLQAVDVYVEEANGGYHLYYEKGGKTYINVEKVTGDDGKEHVNAVLGTTAATVYTYDATLKTLTVKIGDATYAFGTRNDKEYTTVGPCDISKDPFICVFYGSNGSGNADGGTGTDENGNFDLSLIPEPDLTSSSFNGYYVVNGNLPFFTDAEKNTTTCFETYSNLDSLGRVGVAFACVCGNTMPTTNREGQSYKPTGWVQNTSYPGLDHLYDRAHLIAWSLAGENDNAKNLATGTVYLNQTTMQIFENQVLNYLKSNKNTNKVLYRVTPVFNGTNLLCSGILMEAYSLDDNGADIQFCVFVYNVQKGVHLDYATGNNNAASSASDYGTGAGFGAGNSGNTGNNGTTTPSHTCESQCSTCKKCTDKACQEAACREKCNGHNQTSTTLSKATSVSVGDQIVIVYEPANAEFSGINGSNVGTYVTYSGGPTGAWVLTLEAGSQEGTFAIKTPDGKYLYTTNENKIKAKTGEVDDSMSWTITFDESGNAIITNVKLTERVLQWNANSGQERFCCYKGTQKSVQIYK